MAQVDMIENDFRSFIDCPPFDPHSRPQAELDRHFLRSGKENDTHPGGVQEDSRGGADLF
jgi:hypothetical protein